LIYCNWCLIEIYMNTLCVHCYFLLKKLSTSEGFGSNWTLVDITSNVFIMYIFDFEFQKVVVHFLNSMQLSLKHNLFLSWEADSRSATQEIPPLLRNPKVRCRIQENLLRSLFWAR
jgi:hypothetical protein